jgi:hypothetical protein
MLKHGQQKRKNAKIASRDFRIGTVVAFHGRDPPKDVGLLEFALFLFYLKQKTGGNHMKKTKIILKGTANVSDLSAEEQYTLYTTLLARLLALQGGKAV